MTNYFRAVRLALKYRWSVVGIVLTSFVVAVFWGANIGAVYPFVEVVFRGQSLNEYFTDQIAQSEAKTVAFTAEIETLQKQVDAASENDQPAFARKLNQAELRLEAEERALSIFRWCEPHAAAWLPDDPFQTLLLIVALLVVGTLFKDLFLVANLMLVERVTQRATLELRSLFFRRTLRMDLASFGDDKNGSLVSRFTHDMGALAAGINDLFGRMLREPLKAVACLLGAGFICWRLLVFSLLISPLAVLLIRSLAVSLKRANRRAMEEMAQIYSLLTEAFGLIQVVKAFNMERTERQRFQRSAKKFYRKSMKIRFYDALTKPATEIMGMSMIALAILGGGYLVLHEETHLLGIRMTDRPLSLGSLMAFYALLVGVSDPARKFTEVINFLQRGAAAADRIYEMLDREPAVADTTKPVQLPAHSVEDEAPDDESETANEEIVPARFRELVFENIGFHYVPERPILNGLNLHVRAGETLAIVGPNGCGKSTLLNLIPRFYDPTSGAVKLDGLDIRDLRLRDLRSQIGLVTQQPLLFNDTVIANIRRGRPGATYEEITAAAQKAHAHRFITEKLVGGYEFVVGEGGKKLSGGERQRIALARAILRDPSILLLDEATSQVDIADEQLIHDVLEHFVQDRTTIMITHRLSTLALADRVLVMDAGRIIDLGTHQELIARCDTYRRLHEIHFRQAG